MIWIIKGNLAPARSTIKPCCVPPKTCGSAPKLCWKKGSRDDDASEIRDLLKQSAEAVKLHHREKLSALNDQLSDIIFYLED